MIMMIVTITCLLGHDYDDSDNNADDLLSPRSVREAVTFPLQQNP